MTTMPVSLQERIPLAVGGHHGPPPAAAAAMTPGDIVRILKQRIFLILFIWLAITAITVAGTWYWDRHFATYRAQAIVMVEAPRQGPLEFGEPMLQGELMDRMVQQQVVVATSPSVLEEVIKSRDVMETQWYRDNWAKYKERLLDELKRQLSVVQAPRTNYMAVSITTRDPADSAIIVNAVVSKYLAHLEANSATELRKQYESYRQQTNEALQRLRTRRNEKKQFVASFQVPGVTEGINVAGETLRSLSDAVTRLEAEKLQHRAAWENLRGLGHQGLAMSPQLSQYIQQDPQIFTLTSQLVNLEQQREIAMRRVGKNHRDVRQIETSIEAVQAKLEEIQLQKEQEILDFQIRSTEQAYLNTMHAELQLRDRLEYQTAVQADIDMKLAEYRALEEDEKLLEEEYRQLQLFTSQLGLMLAGESKVNVRRVSDARPPREKYMPNWKINLPAGSVLGLILGVGLALLLELMDTSIKTSRDVPRHVHVPILGTIPHVDDEEVKIDQVELASRTAPRSMVAEAFRAIRTNLLLSSPAERQRTVLVASARPEEGRTTVAINLALSIAQNGRRVLLVDANFHRPAVQQFFPNAKGTGLSNILIGQARLADAAVTTDLPNLDVLTSGPIPPNPTELLAGPYLSRMITEALERYDQIIFDGPPVLLVSDGLVLAGVVDGVILVCRAKATSRGVALRGREQLERVNGRIFGAVLNAAQVTRGGYYREQIRSYYEYQPEESLTATSVPVLPPQDDSKQA
ncbi:MAG TPA: polysaccharide biosynthesis tyrosine autokinase [Phycisphaerae bacterium]|nr:polysaccharide biosynthesis tyrosine autokinase [Phycisphaerae bacterium]HOJ72322.1 polysaccharide biosynthesis tyrosine autokinase [Phycisphaerae bacterium]HOM50016.1 polysaccharide biosynthesis tyrosine autokinase [Phycisphaerae bacterium]HON65339.1 polysaccharide biosynthesis tyrosine autokinase [Phycisphaerae bacterium]HOQ84736.1 polysaccharide biosynthesis tyrosine autokinase [Phycisphaerae bacterium]